MDIPALCHEDTTSCNPWEGCSPDTCGDKVKECEADDKKCLALPKPECKEDGTLCAMKPNFAKIRRK